MKVFKLKQRTHVNSMHTQKPNNHFNTKTLKIIKSPKISNFKNFMKIYDLCMNECNLIKKRKGKRVMPNVVDENP